MCDIIPDGLKQDGSGKMSVGGREKWGPWLSHLFFPVSSERVVLFGSHRAPAIPPEFYQWREEGDIREL